MKILTLRGVDWKVDESKKEMYLTINKAMKDKFSISDVAWKKVQVGYTAKITVLGKEVVITKNTTILFKEEVPSKFDGMESWYRIWFPIRFKEKPQCKWWSRRKKKIHCSSF